MRWLLGVALAGADFLPGPARALTPEGEPMVPGRAFEVQGGIAAIGATESLPRTPHAMYIAETAAYSRNCAACSWIYS